MPYRSIAGRTARIASARITGTGLSVPPLMIVSAIIFGAGKALALLAYLVVEPDYPRRREVLAALLWPDQPEESARHSLRQALTSVRQRLDDQAADPPHLIVSRDTVAFNATSDYQLDVATFDALLDACHDHPHRHADACAERL